jgi:DNA-binding GntR family transcriptional regulator
VTVQPRDRGSVRLAHQHIVGRISSGDFASGSALSELSLAAQLGISRTPVREAIGQLVADGILQKSSRGAVVAMPTRQDIIDLYEMREAFEVFNIGKVAGRGLSARELEAVRAEVEQVKTAAAQLKASGDDLLRGEALRNFLACDLRFHTRLLQAGGNVRMLRQLDATNLLLRVFTLRREHHTVALLEEVYSYHLGIVNAVAAGKPDKAKKLLADHIHLSRNERLAEYEDYHLHQSIGIAR